MITGNVQEFIVDYEIGLDTVDVLVKLRLKPPSGMKVIHTHESFGYGSEIFRFQFALCNH